MSQKYEFEFIAGGVVKDSDGNVISGNSALVDVTDAQE